MVEKATTDEDGPTIELVPAAAEDGEDAADDAEAHEDRVRRRRVCLLAAGEQRGVQTSPSTSCLDPGSRNMVRCPAEYRR